MPRTALVHFGEDVARARAILAHADSLPQTTDAERLLRSDLLRSAWMFAVGALGPETLARITEGAMLIFAGTCLRLLGYRVIGK